MNKTWLRPLKKHIVEYKIVNRLYQMGLYKDTIIKPFIYLPQKWHFL